MAACRHVEQPHAPCWISWQPANVVQRWHVAGWRDGYSQLRANSGCTMCWVLLVVRKGKAQLCCTVPEYCQAKRLCWILCKTKDGWFLTALTKKGVFCIEVPTRAIADTDSNSISFEVKDEVDSGACQIINQPSWRKSACGVSSW